MNENNNSADGTAASHSRITARTLLLLSLLAVAGAIAGYLALSYSSSVTGRAQEPSPRESSPFFIKEGERITVPPNSPLRGKLVIAAVEDKEIQRSLVLPAVVEADPARTVKILPPVGGRVVDLNVQLGGRVSKGDILAIIDSGDLAQAFSDVEKARASITLAKKALDRLTVLEKTSAIAVKEREQAQNDYAQAQSELERAQSRLRAIGVSEEQKSDSRLLPVKSPVSGSVIDLQIAPGAFINDPTAAMMTIADLATVWVTANVPEKDTSQVSTGESVEVEFTAYPGEVFKGQVLFVSDVLDPDTRRTKVRIAFDNPNVRLKPNMFANATFLTRRQMMPVVPTNALVLKDDNDQVFVEVEPWVFEPRRVDVAFQEGDQAMIGRGLKGGERVVVKGGVLLND